MDYILTKRGKKVCITFLLVCIIPAAYSLPLFNAEKSVAKIKRSSRLSAVQAFETRHKEKMALWERELAIKEKELEIQKQKLEFEEEARWKRWEVEEAERKQRMEIEMEERKTFLEVLKKHLLS